MTEQKKRIYATWFSFNTGEKDKPTIKGVRLVRAKTPASVLKHITDKEFTVRIATQDELIDFVRAGGEIEDAGEPE